ncbi:MAG: methyl-accepting chemotaxis protein [Thermovenabulum sp.]|uniref:methyl-accepting chemotaxis protein n=1 Tax=Thermovenabulum sp. TaxID=3100335 RepID=UPI003C7C3332
MVAGNNAEKSNNLLKNIRFTNLLLLFIVIIAISLGSISLLAIKDMKVLSDDMNNLYNDRMLPSLQLKEMETDSYKIRVALVQMVHSNRYDADLEKQINEKKDSVNKILDSYRNSKMSDEQRQMFSEIESSYRVYMDNAALLIGKLKTNNIISEAEIQKLDELTANMQNAIDNLVRLNAETAADVVNKANSAYSKSRNIFIGLFIIITAIAVILGVILLRFLRASMAQINFVAERLSQYDFTVELDESGNNEFAQMNRSLKIIIENIKKAIGEVKNEAEKLAASSQNLTAVSEEMASSSQELAKTMQQVAEGATSQANDLQDIVSLIAVLTNNIENVYKELQDVKNETDNTTDKANIGKREMDKLIKSIEEIRHAFEVVITKVNNLTNSVREINNITNLINEISEQTNLLALNAAIEAARAGELGRGFAVVAEEVRKLAEGTKKSTEEIKQLISLIQKDTQEVIETSDEVENFIEAQTSAVENTVKAFADILDSVRNIAPLMDRTYQGMDEIVKSKNEVLSKVEAVSSVTQEHSAAAEEVAASSEELSASSEEVAATAQSLSSMAVDLANIVNRFKVA